jgi:hypothetical protein
MRAWKGLKTAMGNVLHLRLKSSILIIYTPVADSAREKREKDRGFSGERDQAETLSRTATKKRARFLRTGDAPGELVMRADYLLTVNQSSPGL